MRKIFDTIVPRFIVDINRNNEDIIIVSGSSFSPQGDLYTVNRAAVSPSLILTTQSLNELKPEVSNVYPYAAVTPTDYDGSTRIVTRYLTTAPTASQLYYVPVYTERYNQDVVRLIDTEFTELTVITGDV